MEEAEQLLAFCTCTFWRLPDSWARALTWPIYYCMFDFSEFCMCVCVCVSRVCMWWKWCSGVSHGGSEFSRPAAQLSSCASSGEAPTFMGKSQGHFRWHSQGLRGSHWEEQPRSADTAGAISSYAPPNALCCQKHNMKSDHAPLTVGIISPLSVTLFKFTERLLQCMPAIWAPVKVNTRHEFGSLILLLMSCAFTPI